MIRLMLGAIAFGALAYALALYVMVLAAGGRLQDLLTWFLH